MTTKKRTTYRAALCTSAGELDMISADDLETLQRQLGKRLVTQNWLLADGDTITITSGDVEQVI
jgi:hypothetical protein